MPGITVAPDHAVAHHQIADAIDARRGIEDARAADDHGGGITGTLRKAHPLVGRDGAHAASATMSAPPSAGRDAASLSTS
jgi:hypothetical protein